MINDPWAAALGSSWTPGCSPVPGRQPVYVSSGVAVSSPSVTNRAHTPVPLALWEEQKSLSFPRKQFIIQAGWLFIVEGKAVAFG